jgi:hypothetical protein
MRSIRFRACLYAVLAFAVVLGLAAVALAAGTRVNPDLKPPTLLGPAPNLTVEPGTAVSFRIRTHARDVGLVVRVSRSSVRGRCGVIAANAGRYAFVRTGTPAVYQATGSMPSTPGRYFWQAYRIGGRDGCVESAVRSLQLVPKPLALSESRLEGSFDMTSRITAVNGFSMDVGDTDDITFTLKPNCASGPCDTSLSFGVKGITPLVSETVTVPLVRSGAVYSGSGPAPLSTCGFITNTVTGTLDVRLEVTAGSWSGNQWRATTLVGHERYSTQPTFAGIWACPAAWWEADLSGKL